MPLAIPSLPYGLREVKVTPLGADGATPGTAVKLPFMQTLEFKESEDFQTLRGDDADQATHGSGPHLEWSLESGGLPLEAYAVINGGTVTTSGVTPALKKTYSKSISDQKPYFKMEGQVISDNGGDVHGLVYRCKVTGNIGGTFQDGGFYTTGADGVGYGSLEATKVGKLYDFVNNETAIAIP